jgi:hypothetical protein
MEAVMTDRVRCCIPECRRSFKPSVAALEHDHDEIMCGRCYRTVEPRLIARHKTIHRRWRKAERLLRVKATRDKPALLIQVDCMDGQFRRACARSWAAIKQDATIKSAMRVEGTAGELAARKAHK